MPTKNPIYAAIDKQHQQMSELFLMHQEALMLEKVDLAADIYQSYQALQLAHLAFENDCLLPELAKLESPRWPHTLYQHEHNKIEDLLAKHAQNIENSQTFLDKPNTTAQAYRRWIIELFDQHKTLKNVLEHHEQREEQGLLPELNNALSEEQIESVCQQLQEFTQASLDRIFDRSQAWIMALNDVE